MLLAFQSLADAALTGVLLDAKKPPIAIATAAKIVVVLELFTYFTSNVFVAMSCVSLT